MVFRTFEVNVDDGRVSPGVTLEVGAWLITAFLTMCAAAAANACFLVSLDGSCAAYNTNGGVSMAWTVYQYALQLSTAYP